MFPNDSHRCLNEHPQNKAEPAWLCLSFLVEIIERLLYRLAKMLPESSWVKVEEFLVEYSGSCLFIHKNNFRNRLSNRSLEPL